MPVGQFSETKKSWYSIGKETGKITRKLKDAPPESFDWMAGFLKSVALEEGEYEGRPANKYVFTMEERDGSEIHVLRMGEDSNCAYDSLNRIANIPAGKIGEIKFTPYISDWTPPDGTVAKKITHMSIQHNSVKIQGKFKSEDIPKVQRVKVGKQEVVDKSEKQEFFLKIAHEINERLKAQYGLVDEEPASDLEPGIDDEIPF